MIFELMDCTNTLLREIAEPQSTRKDIAKTYALALRSTIETDWGAVNKAIIAKWSFSGLNWIKKQAHSGKCFEEAKS